MTDTPNLVLPYIAAAQAQKHVTHNEAIRALDAIVQLSVIDRDLTAAPGAPVDGDRYIVAVAASGVWAGKDEQIAAYQDGAWAYYQPREGWLAWVSDEDKLLGFDGTVWSEISSSGGGGGSVNPTPLVGVNATADTTNRLSVSSANSLFSHEGSDHRIKINKALSTDTASVLFQDNFSGRAEIGLTGDDDFHFKVSPDGTAWKDAIQIDRGTGVVTFPFTSLGGGSAGAAPNLLVNPDFQINQRGFTGGVLAAGAYGFDRWKAAAGGATLSLSGMVLTLTSGEIVQVFEPAEFGHGSLASTQITVSVEDLSSGDLTVTAGSAAASTISAGSGRQAVTITTGAGDTGNIEVKLSPASGAVTFGRVKAEVGNTATPWQARPLHLELAMCQRYFAKSFDLSVTPANNVSGDTYAGFSFSTVKSDVERLTYPVRMRAQPTIAVFSSTNGGAPTPGQFQWFLPGSGWQNSTLTQITAVSELGFMPKITGTGMTSGNAIITAGAWTADAEL